MSLFISMRFVCLTVLMGVSSLGTSLGEEAISSQQTIQWYSSLKEGLAVAKASNKPVFLEFRCAPCVNGRKFDAQVYYTPRDSARGKLMDQYICVRVTSMTGVNIAHYDRDWHNSLYYFIINADEKIYLRYGGRDELAADSYLNLDSLEIALQLGLQKHKKEQAKPTVNTIKKPTYPRDYPLLNKEVIHAGRCVECHLVGDYIAREKEASGILNPIEDIYQSPDIKTLGIFLDVPKGLVLAKSLGAAKVARLVSGDLITSINGNQVLTFGDLQYQYNKVPRSSKTISLGVLRDQKQIRVTLSLPSEWWKTDTHFRHWSVEPRIFFKAAQLSGEEKTKLNIPASHLAAKIMAVDIEAVLGKHHQLKVGDIITGVNGVSINPLTTDVATHINLKHRPDETLRLTVIRDGKTIEQPLKTSRLKFRKVPSQMQTGKTNQTTFHWSKPAFVSYGTQQVLRYRMLVSNNHLIIEAKHKDGWHSFAMDNKQRLINKGGKGKDQEQPTVIRLPSWLETQGLWLQSRPTDYSKPEIHWHTWGHADTSYFAIKLKKPNTQQLTISLDCQICNDDSCAGGSDIKLNLPPQTTMPRSVEIRNILDRLEPIMTSRKN